MPKSIYLDNTDLTREKRFTFITEDLVVGGATLAVQSILGFQNLDTSSGQIVMIGEIGNEKTELLRTSNTSGQSPSQNYKWVYLRDTLNFDHPQDTKVTIVDWNRGDIQWSATTTGSKSTITAYPVLVQPDQKETLYVDTSQTTGYYFVRFNETIGNNNSDWSDPIPFGGFDDNTVFMIKKRALDQCNEVIDGQILTHELLNQWLWEARREYHHAPGRRPFRRKFNFAIGTALTGSFRVELPVDVEDPFSGQNIYGVRIGSNPNMTYYDKKRWDFDYISKPHSTLDVPYTRGISTSIWLANGKDFSQSGNVSFEGMTIGYTKVTGSNNSLTITSHGSYSAASAGSDAWQNVVYGLPDKFTVWADPQGSAYVYFNRPIDTAYVNQNIYADYYRTVVAYDSDSDILDEPRYDIFVSYLAFKIRQRKNRGNIPVVRSRTGQPIIADVDYQNWIAGKNEALSKEYLGTEIRISPDVPPFPNFPYY